MNVYLGYKYKNNQNKQALQDNLEQISKKFEDGCHKCFVLGRDVHGWHINHVSTSKSLTPIISNIRKSDMLFAFIDHEGESLGLRFEMICAKLLRKPIILAIKKGLKEKFFRTFSKNTIEFNDTQDLLVKIPSYFPSA